MRWSVFILSNSLRSCEIGEVFNNSQKRGRKVRKNDFGHLNEAYE